MMQDVLGPPKITKKLYGVQVVGGSNPLTPTKLNQEVEQNGRTPFGRFLFQA